MNTPITLSRPHRCQVGDLVMIVRSKNPIRLGRIGTIVCGTKTAAAAALSHPEDLAEVQRRDWVVDFQGAPDVTYRGGEAIVAHLLACADATLMPLRAAPEDVDCEAALPAGGCGMTSRPLTIKEACEALDRAAEALRQTGSLFHVIAHARQSGLDDMLNTLDMAEIGIHISGEVAEQTQDWADLFRPLLAKANEVAR